MRAQQPAVAGQVGSIASFLVLWLIPFVLALAAYVLVRVIADRWAWQLAVVDPHPETAYLAVAYVIAGLVSVGVFALGQWYVARRWLPRPKLWALMTALGLIAGDVIASHVAATVIIAGGGPQQPFGFFLSLPDLIRLNLPLIHGVYAACLLSTCTILAMTMAGLQLLALPFPWRQKALWLVASSLGGLAAVAVAVAAVGPLFRILPRTALTWFAHRLGLLLIGEVLWLGPGVLVFGLLTGLTLFQLARWHHRIAADAVPHRFD